MYVQSVYVHLGKGSERIIFTLYIPFKRMAVDVDKLQKPKQDQSNEGGKCFTSLFLIVYFFYF